MCVLSKKYNGHELYTQRNLCVKFHVKTANGYEETASTRFGWRKKEGIRPKKKASPVKGGKVIIAIYKTLNTIFSQLNFRLKK